MLSTSHTLCTDMRNVHLLLPPEKIVLNLCGSIFLVFFVFITIRKKLLNGLPAFMLFYMNYHTHTHNPGFFIDILFLSCVFFFSSFCFILLYNAFPFIFIIRLILNWCSCSQTKYSLFCFQYILMSTFRVCMSGIE